MYWEKFLLLKSILLSRWFAESQTEISVFKQFHTFAYFNSLSPSFSFWLSLLLLKCMPVIIFLKFPELMKKAEFTLVF